jgi:hypothetical protein
MAEVVHEYGQLTEEGRIELAPVSDDLLWALARLADVHRRIDDDGVQLVCSNVGFPACVQAGANHDVESHLLSGMSERAAQSVRCRPVS